MKYIYLEKDLPQKSQEWHDFRLNHLGASEVPKIMGELPYFFGTPYDIFLLKMGKPQPPPNKNMIRGIEFEEPARNFVTEYLKSKFLGIYNKINENILDYTNYNLKFEPNFKQITAKHKKINHISASFDGIDKKNGLILEVKCPKYENFIKFTKKSKLPSTYKSQVQTQLMVANSHWGITKGIFISYYHDGVDYKNKIENSDELIKMVILEIEIDQEHCKKIEKTCNKFWKMVECRQWNKYWKEEEDI